MEKVKLEVEVDRRVLDALEASARESGSTVAGVIARLARLERERVAREGTPGVVGATDDEVDEALAGLRRVVA